MNKPVHTWSHRKPTLKNSLKSPDDNWMALFMSASEAYLQSMHTLIMLNTVIEINNDWLGRMQFDVSYWFAISYKRL